MDDNIEFSAQEVLEQLPEDLLKQVRDYLVASAAYLESQGALDPLDSFAAECARVAYEEMWMWGIEESTT